MKETALTVTAKSSSDSLFPLEFYEHVQDTIDSILGSNGEVYDQETIDEVFSLLSHFLKLNYGRLYVYDMDHHRLDAKYGQSIDLDALTRGQYLCGEGITGQAFIEEEVVYVMDIENEPHYKGRSLKAGDLPYKHPCYLAVPFYGECFAGVIGFHLSQRSRVDILASVAIVSMLAESIGNSYLPFTQYAA